MDKDININSDNIDDYYRKVNDAIDGYSVDWKVRPNSLKRFLKPDSKGLENFIEKNKFSNVKNIEKVILDIVNDRVGMVDDGVLTFENFNTDKNPINESFDSPFVFDAIKAPDVPIKYEKILADFYRTSLGHVERVDINDHKWGVDDKEVFILSKEEVEEMRGKIIEHSFNALETLTFDDMVMDIYIPGVSLKGMIDYEKFANELHDKLNLKQILTIITDDISSDDYDHPKEFKGFYIWEQ